LKLRHTKLNFVNKEFKSDVTANGAWQPFVMASTRSADNRNTSIEWNEQQRERTGNFNWWGNL